MVKADTDVTASVGHALAVFHPVVKDRDRGGSTRGAGARDLALASAATS